MEERSILERVWIFIVVPLIGALAQLARMLTGSRPFTIVQLIGAMLGSAIAAFSFGAIILDRGSSELIALALAGPVGWLGGSFLGSLALQIERRLGNGDNSPKRPG